MEVKNNISLTNVENKNNNNISNISSINSNVKQDKQAIKDDNNEKNNNKNSINRKELDKLFSEINEEFKTTDKQFSYEIHEETNRVMVKIKDSSNGKVLKEIPTEESLDLSARILEMAGLLIDKKS